MQTGWHVVALSLGGALGVNAHYWLGVWMSRWASPQFPWATFTINVSGSFAIGFLTTLLARWLPHPHWRLLVLVGFLGGYTTFSTFAFESLTLWERGERGLSVVNIAGSVAAGLVAVALGAALAQDSPSRGPSIARNPARPAAGDLSNERADAVLLKAYVNATDRWNGRPLYEVIVAEALASGLAGASVFPVTCSYGAGLRIHDTASDYQFADAPVVIEIVDDPPRVEALLDVIGPMLSGGLLTVEAVRVGDHDSDAARD